jgi:peptidoglycan/LPS O-acetylase OafA/YrhL
VTDHARFPLLDGYRALAVGLVLTTHVGFFSGVIFLPGVGALVARMDFGVTLFFLLSGFLLYRPWALAAMSGASAPNLRIYALRRSGRILPAYWVMAAVVLVALPYLLPIARADWADWVKYLGLAHIYSGDLPLAGLGQIWSLATELAFYAALPIIAWVAGRVGRGDVKRSSRRQLTVLTCCAGIAVGFNFLSAGPFSGTLPAADTWLPAHLDWFAAGMALAVVHSRLDLPTPPRWMAVVRRLAQDTPTCLVIAGALFVLAATPIAGPAAYEAPHTPQSLLMKNAIYLVIAVALLLPGFLGGAQAHHSMWGRVLAHPLVVYVGVVSYGFFLWHMAVLTVLAHELGWGMHWGTFFVLWVGTAIIAMALATLSWRALERPVQKFTHRWRPQGSR